MTITDFGVAIVDTDTHLSKWVLEHRTLAVADKFLRQFSKYIPKNGAVADIGACIGDHTVTYAEMVGRNGIVYAFEPNPDAFECLAYNTQSIMHVFPFPTAIGASYCKTASIPTEPNLGSSQLSLTGGEILVETLDVVGRFWPRLDFIKLDCEGYEPDAIEGGMEIIARFKPVMLIEVNHAILESRGRSSYDIINPLRKLGYSVAPAESGWSLEMPQVDVLAIPPL